jgi:CBS domain-containing protein
MTTVRQLLQSKDSGNLWTISPEDTVHEALETLARNNLGALPVVEGKRLVGIFSERDYTHKAVLKGKTSTERPVRDLMTVDVVSVSANESVERCMRLMTNNHFRHLPVVEGGELIGIVSIGDLLKLALDRASVTQKTITPEGDTLEQ